MQLVEPAALAVERYSGRVFVGDPGSGYVDVYSSTGEFQTRLGEGVIDATGVAVDESSGDVYLAEPFRNAVLCYAPDGKGGYRPLAQWFGQKTPGREFGQVAAVAVDDSNGPSAGDLYVLEARAVGGETGAVDVFRPKPNPAEGEGQEGEFLKRLSGPQLESPNAIVVSPSTGRVLVADSRKGAIYAYSDEGAYQEKLNGKGSPNGAFSAKEEAGNVAALAVDQTNGDIYVAEAERHAVSQYSEIGEWEGWITTTPTADLAEPGGVALTPAGEVYVADAGLSLVDRFGAGALVPSVETGKVAKSSLTRTSAVLSGTIDGQGKPASYRFQYGETPALGSETQSESSGTGSQAVSAAIEGLKAGHVYYFRIAGEDEDGANYGVIRQFETSPAVEALETGPVKSLTQEGATLSGSLKRGSLETHFYFQYGPTSAYGKESPEPPAEVPAGKEEKEEKEAKALEASVASLTPNTLYHYRVVAFNSYGSTYGSDKTFTTQGPPTITYQPASAITQHEATIHAQIDPDQLTTTYRFQYGETTAYGTEVPLGGEAIGSGSAPVARSAALTGLKAGTTYHYRIVAENEAGTATGADQTLTTVPSAPVDATWATAVGTSEATLHTQINPLGNDTRFYFQYGAQSCEANPGACTNAPAPPGEDIGSGSEDVAREATLAGLQPDTTYYYRVLASNAQGETQGHEHTFRTQQETSFALPDNRAWEMVSPPDKHGAPVEALTREGGLILSSEDGSALTYLVDNALGEEAQGNRSPEWQQILATRSASGWSSKDIATPSSKAKGATPGQAPEYQFFSSNLASALVEPVAAGQNAEPPLASGVTQATMYLRDTASATFLPLVTEANTAPGTKFGGSIHFVSATPDLSHVVIESGVALTGAGSAPGLYEWAAGSLKLVSVLPSGAPASPAELGFYHVAAHAISRDGSRVIWTKKEESTAAGHLYLRDVVKGQTIRLDAAQGLAEPSKGSAQFQWASSDGSRVFFTDKQRLTPDSTADPGEPPSADLYQCVITEEKGRLVCDLKDLTVDHNGGEHAAVQYFILGASEDGSSVYLIAHGVLASNHNGNGETAQASRDNLYELHFDGTQWSRTFIATLSGEDSQEWEGFHVGNSAFLTAQVSPDGKYLAFMSQAPITGYDNVDANPEAKAARDEEVFLYDSATASLRCVSCNPSGARPSGVLDSEQSGEGLGLLVDRREIWLGHRLAGNIPGWTAQTLTSALFQSRYLSDEGRLYFNSPDSLVPAAKNGKEDVYQYEPSGVGSCQSSTGACISLISSGGSDRESAFLEATPHGSNVFFITEARLLPQDTDTAFDIYDARECSAVSPCLSPPAATEPPCAGTQTCRQAAPAQPILGATPATVPITATENVASSTQPAKQEREAIKTAKPVTRAQKLKRALKICRKRHAHSKSRRKACERRARRRYSKHRAGSKHKAGRRSRTGSSKRGRVGR